MYENFSQKCHELCFDKICLILPKKPRDSGETHSGMISKQSTQQDT